MITMKSRGLIDFYLPAWLAYHLKIVLASLLISFFYSQFRFGAPWSEGSVHMLILLVLQLELFLWLGTKFFSKDSYVTPGNFIKKMVLRLALFYLLAFFLSILIYLSYLFIIYLVMGYDMDQLIPTVIRTETRSFLIAISVGYLFGAVMFFYFQWRDALKREQKLREEQLIFQYETLKSQVNPHFLFNSLNTLSSLVYRDPELSDEYIGKLSSIYRYILENVNVDLVSLEQEIEFVNKYFALQQVRDDGKIDLDISIDHPDAYEILPISLQLLMENAFKHNAATREQPLKLKIRLDAEDGMVEFSNNYQPKVQMEGSNRIGLKNLTERIRLILHREMEVMKQGDEFKVRVPVIKTEK
jgi:two-component system, LytTR family, sensor kinase